MKSFLLAAFAFVSILSSSKAFAEYCPTSAKINAESQLAMDNLQILEEEARELYPRSSFIVLADINTIRAVLMSVNSMSDSNYNSCINIKATFYTINFSINNLSINVQNLMSQDQNSPLRAFWNTFLSSFLTLERTIERSPGRYTVPRGPFYRRFFGGLGGAGVCQIRQYSGGSVIVCADAIMPGGYNTNPAPRARRRYLRGDRRDRNYRGTRRGRTRRQGRWFQSNPNPNPNVNPGINPNQNPNVNPGINPNPNSDINPSINPDPNPGTRRSKVPRRSRRRRRN